MHKGDTFKPQEAMTFLTIMLAVSRQSQIKSFNLGVIHISIHDFVFVSSYKGELGMLFQSTTLRFGLMPNISKKIKKITKLILKHKQYVTHFVSST